MPKVSVVLTSYNHADFISESIESVLNQTFSDFELYIVDDCSPDRSWEIIQDYAKKDSRIVPIRHQKNIGGAIKPDLIDQLRGKYFCIAHCDDKWALDKLEKQVTYMDAHPNIGSCFTWVEYIDDNGNILKNTGKKYTDFNLKNRDRFAWLRHFFYEGNCLCHPSVMLRTKIQREENLYSYGLAALPDLNRWIKLCLKHEIYIYPKKLTFFRIRHHAGNTSGNTTANIYRCQFDLIQILKNYQNLSKNDFLKVFPEAKKYIVDRKIIQEFALARLSIEHATLPPYLLFGFQLIYNLLQNSETRSSLETLYNYRGKNFTTELGQHDIFNVVNPNRIIQTSLFIDTGNGFNESEKISQSILLNDSYFELHFNNLPKNIIGLRFDPDEGNFRKFKNLHISIDNHYTNYHSNGNKEETSDWLYFFTTDPQIYPSLPEKINNIVISGTTELINPSELSQVIAKKPGNNYSFFQRFFKR